MKNYANNSYLNSNKWINNKFSDEGTQTLMADDCCSLLSSLLLTLFVGVVLCVTERDTGTISLGAQECVCVCVEQVTSGMSMLIIRVINYLCK